MFPQVRLIPANREDAIRVAEWLDDSEVSSMWYGIGDDGVPIHIGYSPHKLVDAADDEVQEIFEHEDRKIYSIYTQEGDHIGEAQLVVEWPLQEAQAFILVGRKDLWHHHYGTMAMVGLLDEAYDSLGLHRVWVDVPEYSEHAIQLCQHIGFVLEGHLRETHLKDGEWFDSRAMGLLADEYARRRSRLMGNSAA